MSMSTNSDCTIYTRIRGNSLSGDTWKRQYVRECWWFEDTKSSITTEGLKSADVLTVRIPDLSVKVKKGDYIIKGRSNVTIQTVADLPEDECFEVTSANYNRFGMNPHIKVVGV